LPSILSSHIFLILSPKFFSKSATFSDSSFDVFLNALAIFSSWEVSGKLSISSLFI
jgi:hypothetical protein